MTQPAFSFTKPIPRFHGSEFDPALDQKRLTVQQRRIFCALADGRSRTLREISALTGDGEASISAQCRHIRSQGFQLEKQRRGEPSRGCWEYRLVFA